MEGIWMLGVLLAGMVGAAWLTTKINYFTYGQNSERREKEKKGKSSENA